MLTDLVTESLRYKSSRVHLAALEPAVALVLKEDVAREPDQIHLVLKA
jgi:hypothetical protein